MLHNTAQALKALQARRAGDFTHPRFTNTIPNNPSAIKAYQRKHGLVADGIVGPITNSMMRRTHTRLAPAPVRPTRPLGNAPDLKPAYQAGRVIYGHDELH